LRDGLARTDAQADKGSDEPEHQNSEARHWGIVRMFGRLVTAKAVRYELVLQLMKLM
jgi:hypothetical protein